MSFLLCYHLGPLLCPGGKEFLLQPSKNPHSEVSMCNYLFPGWKILGGSILLVCFTFWSCWAGSISDCFSESFLVGPTWTPRTTWRAGHKRRHRTTWKGCKECPKQQLREEGLGIVHCQSKTELYFFCLMVCKAQKAPSLSPGEGFPLQKED